MTDALLHDEKRFYERFFALVKDPQLVRVMKKFGVEPFRRSSVLEGFDDMLQARKFRGERCMEIGSWMGLTAIVLARYFDEVVSVDIQPNAEKHAIVKFLGVKNIRFIDVQDNAEKASVIGSEQFDAAYCDGDHAKDTELDFSIVQRCGNVLFHEAWEAQPPVMELLRRLRATGGNVTTRGKFAHWRPE